MKWMILLAVLLGAYLIGSFPSALVYSRLRHGKDIRRMGDGNMGARNIKRHFGLRAGVLVALADIVKGLTAVWVADLAALPLEGQLLAGAAVIAGHDYPVFAGFKGGQGFAATTGVFLYLFPLPALIGLVIYTAVYLLTRSSDLGAGLGMGQLFLHEIFTGAEVISLAFIVGMLLFIPLKQRLDRGRVDEERRNFDQNLPA